MAAAVARGSAKSAVERRQDATNFCDSRISTHAARSRGLRLIPVASAIWWWV